MWSFKKKPVRYTPLSDIHGGNKILPIHYYQVYDGLHSKIQAGSVKSLQPGEAYYPIPTNAVKFHPVGHWHTIGDLMPAAKPKHIDLFS